MREFYEVISEHPFISCALGLFILMLADIIGDAFKRR